MNKRLNTLCSLVENCNKLADIGCDHGKIGISLILDNKCKHVYLCDISQKSLQKACANATKLQIQDKCIFVCCDGFDKVPQVDTAVIAGMGGKEIISILEKACFLPNTLVLQPMKNQAELRRYLQKNYFLKQDFLIKDKKFYFFILATLGKDNLSQDELLVGKTNLTSQSGDYKEWLKYQYNQTQKHKDYSDNLERSSVYERLMRQGDK